jgi:hypothetical protein
MSDKTKFYFCEWLFLAVPFPTHSPKKSENVSAEQLFLQEKAVLEETCLASGRWLACLLHQLGKLFLPCKSYQAQHCPADVASADDQTGLPIGSVLSRLHHVFALGVFRVTSPTPPQVALWGPQKGFFVVDDWRAAICWLVLGGPWKACSWPHKIGQSPTRRFL